MDEYDRAIMHFIDHLAEMIAEGAKKGYGVEVRIYPEDVQKLHKAFKIKGILD